jgi:hypothetical protein
MAQDEPPDSTPRLSEGSSRKGLLRRLVDGLRGTPPPPATGDPRQLGRYRILHRLGQGGMGIVFAALDETLGRKVAVKTIAEPDESARKRFRHEARAAAGVNHPNVCQVYEIGEDGGQLFIAMELVEGESLEGRLKRGPLTVAEAVKLAREMLEALAAALHGAGAGARPRHRRAHRPLLRRGDPVRGDRGAPGLPRRERRRGAVGDAARRATGARRRRRRGRARPLHPPAARQASGGAPGVGGGARRRARGRPALRQLRRPRARPPADAARGAAVPAAAARP